MTNLQAEPLHLREAATVTCIPRLRAGGGGLGVGRRSRRGGGGGGGVSSSSAAAVTTPSQVSVMDRLRDVVLRLAMLSATTMPANKQQGTTATTTLLRRPTASRTEAARVSPASYADSYRSEAVDDCIEFLKRSAAGGAIPATAAATAAVEEGEEASAVAAASPLHAPPRPALHVPRHVNRKLDAQTF